ncbi:SEC14-like protein 2 [Daphnia pulicaria]|uniref:SEC14-like protein 2 n=1 Tax=Daphnia pulicaria TaxID=35523 RepID=UPI001EE9C087|nr:SEC14-like protein 2 [Daphnia pulicaria]XP_046633825.1 SEC14-like protein 2 [Daphnia pulicaria]
MSLTQVRQVQPIVFDQFADDGGTKFKTGCVTKANTAVLQLKIAIKDCTLHDSSDEYLLNWLIVQDFNVARAEKMLRQSLEWRRVNGVDGILQSYTPNEIIKKYFSMGQAGLDKFGSPVFVCCMGRIDFRGLHLSLVKKEYFQFIPWQFENFCLSIKEAGKRNGENIEKMTFIMDYEGLALRQYTCKPAMEIVIEMIKGFLFHYPNHLRRVFIINAPKIFPYLFAMVKPFIPQTDIPKIKIFGCETKQWTSALLEEIDAHQLPAFYGGTLTDPNGDPKCPSKFNMGGEVPSSYYLSNNPPVAKDYMETMSIGAGGRKKMKFKVDVPNSVLRWEFITEAGDIKFRVYSKDSKGSAFDFVPLSRVDSHLDMEEGEITCEEPGKYVLEFDNSFSYLRTKKLRYFIAVDLPSASIEI